MDDLNIPKISASGVDIRVAGAFCPGAAGFEPCSLHRDTNR
jgi:hypothetical protein